MNNENSVLKILTKSKDRDCTFTNYTNFVYFGKNLTVCIIVKASCFLSTKLILYEKNQLNRKITTNIESTSC